MRGAATKSMSDIVEERQQSRCPPAAAPLRAAARRPAGFVARSSHTAGYSSSLAPCQRAWGPAAKCEVISARALSIPEKPQQQPEDKNCRSTEGHRFVITTHQHVLRKMVHSVCPRLDTFTVHLT